MNCSRATRTVGPGLLAISAVTIRVAEHEVHALLSSGESPPVGEEAWLTFRRYHLFERESGRRLRSHASGA